MYYHDSVLLLFAKAPVAGKVNTRLINDIGIDAATKLQHDLIHNRLQMLHKAGICDVRLMCVPDEHNEVFQFCEKQYSITLHTQIGDNLGARMFNGITAALQQYKFCVLIGTDAPALTAETIEQSIEELHNGVEVVIVPAEDGGYVLVAVRQALAFMFENINWGSADVMQQTRNKLTDNNISYKELACCWDVDRLEDYQRYLAMHNSA